MDIGDVQNMDINELARKLSSIMYDDLQVAIK